MTAPAPTPDPRCEAALARLVATRQALRDRLMPPPAYTTGHRPARDPVRRMRAWGRWANARLRHLPATEIVASSLGEWWRRHPLHPLGERLRHEVQTQVLPRVRRHPATSMALVAGFAALLVAARPWRWPGIREAIGRTPARVQRWGLLWAQQVPWEAVWTAATLLWSRPPPHRPDPEGPPQPPHAN